MSSTDLSAQTKLIADAAMGHVERSLERWETNELARSINQRPESKTEYLSGSRRPVKRVYTPADIADIPWEEIGLPGQYPFTRGPYPTMYRGRTWTMRQIAGFGTPDETNQRFQYLIAQGQTGLSVDFDMPTLMGFDSDDPRSIGEVGREGVAVDVLEDMDRLFDNIDLEQISVSMTINPSAWILLAMYVAVAERRGLDLNKLSGTIQNDILKEYIAQKEWIYPPEPSMRIVRDTITYTAGRMARYNPINISGYHISEAGSSALQEAAFTMATTREYVRTVTETGLSVDEFAPRLSFFFVCQADFFEEIAKFRALRRYYARMMREEFGATNPESMRMRFHTQTAAATLTKPQPLNNIVRTALQALAAVLGGTQSLHTNGLDEAYAIPSELAMKVALRTQQIIADETNVVQVIDPLGGSYYVEAMTGEIERGIDEYLRRVDELGGTLPAIRANFFQREIADFAYDFAKRKASGERVVVGVNKYVDENEQQDIEVHKLDPTSERRKIDRLKQVKRGRDAAGHEAALATLVRTAEDASQNIMPATVDAVKANASMGEIVKALEPLFGRYVETPVF
jgi:methylmalonyl-CoA mutase cobalamin-binding domain/chain